ncbi:MAG: AmmeMemoRadiSam system radical SAM enzyme [Bacteroidota bacterium]
MDKRAFLRTGVCGVAGAMLCPLQPVSGIGRIRRGGPPSEPWKWSREAMYQVETPRGIRCQICPNECTLGEGELSDCRNRRVYNGKLYTIAYGNPCAVHVDPIEKKPLYHYLPGSSAFSIATAGCNLACLNCQNWTISQSSPEETENYDLMPDQVVANALKYSCSSIAYTYSEPITFYEYVYDTGRLAHDAGIKNILVSAGYIHPEPLINLCKVLDGANIDLKSMDDSLYLKLNAGKLEPVLTALKILKEQGVWLEITNLVVPSWTDDLDMIKRMCNWLASNGFDDTPLHFSRFHPKHKLQRLPSTPVRTLERARQLAIAEGLKYVYIGNVPGNSATDTHCPSCNQVVVERTGYTVSKNQLTEESTCSHCNTTINGVWK